jgi:hypothetical protein
MTGFRGLYRHPPPSRADGEIFPENSRDSFGMFSES